MQRAKKTAEAKLDLVEQAQVFQVIPRGGDDEFAMEEAIKDLAFLCDSGAHVYGLQPELDEALGVVSAYPLTVRQVHEVVDLYHEDFEVQDLIEQEGKSLEEALKAVSAKTKKRWLKDPERQQLATELAASYREWTAEKSAKAAKRHEEAVEEGRKYTEVDTQKKG